MKLKRILEQHKSQTGGLEFNLGDAYLLKHNRIYSRIRQAAQASKFHLQAGCDTAYQALPLSQLDHILSSRIIPYTDNVSVLNHIDSRLADSIEWDQVSDGLKKNYLFHESCHAVIRTASEVEWGPLSLSASKEAHQEKILRLLFEESFANMCELVAVIEAADVFHRIFFEWNSYIVMFEDRSNLSQTSSQIGFDFLARFMWLAYLHSNLLLPPPNENQFDRMLAYAAAKKNVKSDSKISKSLRALARIAFELNPRFRLNTTGLYLRLSGISGLLPELLKFDYLHSLEKNETYQKLMQSQVDLIVCSG